MDLRPHLVLLAGYHHWAFARLYESLHQVAEAEYRRDCGLHFGSIHGTLNHLLLADRLWYGRFAGRPFAVRRLDEELCGDRAVLQREILHCSGQWSAFVAGLDPERLAGSLAFVTTEGAPRSMPFAATLAHVFNHGTHHRGQISAALTALGHPAPEIDLYFYLLR